MPERPADHACIPRDSVDQLLAAWEAARPDLDFAPVAVVSRLGRVRAHVDREVEALFARHGISGPGFAVLVTLTRLQEPGGVPQRRLMDELGLTSGTVSVRIDRLVADGLVARGAASGDRRNSRITLTDAGRELFERIVPAHLDNERRLLAALGEPERELLADLLRTLLVEFEGSVPPPSAPLRLGLTLAPAHVAISMRQAVGLPPVAGLLVRGVEEGGPAAAAGIQRGDVLREADGRALTAIGALYAAIDDRAGEGAVALVVVRAVEELTLPVRLGARGTGEAPSVAATAGRTARDEHTI
ncbi:MAG: MarR family transcriptional regulator [Thermoleophilia bacterium]|nr:MarR family transcriptional regulator [Thermoleophilia bacterium]